MSISWSVNSLPVRLFESVGGVGAEGNPQLEVEGAPLHFPSHRFHSSVLLYQVIQSEEIKVLLGQDRSPV